MPYLYGASIQGIQSFIFETSMLREIAGASELVEKLCSKESILEAVENDSNGIEWLLTAAGNIRICTDKADVVSEIVLKWPRIVSVKAPGITVSQAVVLYEGPLTGKHIDELERKLRSQRNFAISTEFPGLMATERSRRTGRPAVSKDTSGGGDLDEGTIAKHEANRHASSSLMSKIIPEDFPQHARNSCKFPFDLSDISGSSESSWIAVIHADGNDLGRVIRQISTDVSNNGKCSAVAAIKGFSAAVDRATKTAARSAFRYVLGEDCFQHYDKYPIRPVVLGGDDITVICRADLALEFSKAFLSEFRQESTSALEEVGASHGISSLKTGLSACAGIAFIKDHYPFHYGVKLANELCEQAKRKSKSYGMITTPSSLMFHKVHSSFVEDYASISERELRVEDVSFDIGPLFLEKETPEGAQGLTDFLSTVERLSTPKAPSSGLRRWLTELYRGRDYADSLMIRLKEIASEECGEYMDILNSTIFTRDGSDYSPVYHWLAALSVARAKGR